MPSNWSVPVPGPPHSSTRVPHGSVVVDDVGPGTDVVVVVAGGGSGEPICSATSVTNISTRSPIGSTSPLVGQVAPSSALANAATNRSRQRWTVRGSAGCPDFSARASIPSRHFASLPAALIFAAWQSFGASVIRAAFTSSSKAPTMLSIAAASPIATQGGRASAFTKAEDILSRHAWTFAGSAAEPTATRASSARRQ